MTAAPLTITHDDGREWRVGNETTIVVHSADFGAGSALSWVETEDQTLLTGIGAHGSVRGTAMVEWLARRRGRPVFVVGATEDAVGFYEKLGALGLVTGYTLDDIESYFGIDFGDGEPPRYCGNVHFARALSATAANVPAPAPAPRARVRRPR